MENFSFLKDLAIILISAKFFEVLARKVHAPAVVGQILAGILIGPAVFKLVKGTELTSVLAEIGVIMLMFEAGLATDIKKLKKTGAKATIIACFGVFIPLALGTLLFMCFYGFKSNDPVHLAKGLFIGTIMTATSVSITVAALKELGRLNGYVGTTITSAAIIDDVIGIIVLTLVLSLKDKSVSILTVILKSISFFVLAFIIGWITFKLFSWLDDRYEHTRRITIAAFVYCLAMAFISEKFFGIADITGAFVAGVVLCQLKDSQYIERRVDINAYLIFAPVFFAGIGLKVNFQNINMRLLWFSLAFVVVAMLGKIVGCSGMSRLVGFNTSNSLKIGIGMMTRGEVALITAQKGLDAGLLTPDFFTPVILLILCSSILVPILLKRLYTKHPEID